MFFYFNKNFLIRFYFSRPCDRNVKDVELISGRLRRVEQLCKLPSSVLQQLALVGYYEDLEKGVTCEYTKAFFVFFHNRNGFT